MIMGREGVKAGVAGGRLPLVEYDRNFSDLHPPLDRHEALVESERCYFCSDAPGVAACPTAIGYLEKPVPLAFRGTLRDLSIGVGG